MKLSMLILNLGVRGSIRRIIELSNRMIERGHEAVIYHSDGSQCSWLAQYSRSRSLDDFRFDAHEYVIFFNPQFKGLVKAVRPKFPIFHFLGLNDTLPDLKLALDTGRDGNTKDVRAILLDDEFGLVANCSMLANWITSNYRQCSAVIGGVNFDQFKTITKIKRDQNMILAGGASREIEGTGILLDAFEMLKRTFPDVRLETYAKRGYSQEYLAGLYQTCGLFVDAQLHGGWNNPVAEAFACSAPVVCTDIWGNKDFACNHENCLMVAPGDPNGLYKAMLFMLSNPDKAEKMALSGNRAIQSFTWDRATDQLEAVLTGMAL